LKPEFIEFIENARKPKGQRFRNQLYVFLVCLGISVFIWSLVRLSKDYIYTVNYHINYTNIPSNLRLIGKSDSIIKLNIKIQGFDFFSDQYFKRKNQLFDVSLKNVKIIGRDTYPTGYLLTPHIGRDIATQSSYQLEIFSLSPDTLFFKFERKNLKTMTTIRATTIPVTRTKQTIDTSRIRPDSVQNGSFKSDIKQKKISN
jgi:hypothetical protein